jgi:hypothetical protein
VLLLEVRYLMWVMRSRSEVFSSDPEPSGFFGGDVMMFESVKVWLLWVLTVGSANH